MKLSDFDFELPEELIATRPCEPREAAGLLHVERGGLRSDKRIGDLPDVLRKGDLLVFNNTKVIPARLFGKRGDAKVEVTLHKEVSGQPLAASRQEDNEPVFGGGASESLTRELATDGSAGCVPPSGEAAERTLYKAFAKPAKKLKQGDVFVVAEGFEAEVLEKGEGGEVTLAFNVAGPEFHAALAEHGVMPLPPYIAAKRAAEASDEDDYQTIFAEHEGAVAAPTASLHFTDELMEQLAAKGVEHCFVTLHVGAGTFLPVKTDEVSEHQMHSEWCEVGWETAEKINMTKAAGGRVIPVGTTSLRTLESAVDEMGWMHPCVMDTDIFITPGYKFRCTDALMTNFHTPRSTLFMLVSALMGQDVMKAAYAHAIREEYRFYSYGDACLLDVRGVCEPE